MLKAGSKDFFVNIWQNSKVGIFFQRQSNFFKSEPIYEIPPSGNHLQGYLTRNKPS